MNRLFTIVSVCLIVLAFAGCNSDSPPGAVSGGDARSAKGSSVSTSASPFEQMLAHIPDISDSRQSLLVFDIAKMRSELGIDAPSDEATSEQIIEYQTALIIGAHKGMNAQLNVGEMWLSGFTDYVGTFEATTFDSLGFDSRNVDQVASFGDRTMFSREVMLGSFSPAISSKRLAACDDCKPHKVVTHSGTDYYAWGDDFKGSLRNQFLPPAFDYLGRGGRIFVRDGMVSRTLSHEYMEQIIDASTDVMPSLADNSSYVLAAKTLSKYDAATARFSAIALTAESSIKQMEELWESGLQKVVTIEKLEEQFSQAHLLLPYEVAAVGTAFPISDGAPANTYAVLVHSSEADAAENADRLKQRIEEDEFLIGSNLRIGLVIGDGKAVTWLEYFTDYQISTEGKAVILRVSAEHSGDALSKSLLWQPEDPIFIHNLFVTE